MSNETKPMDGRTVPRAWAAMERMERNHGASWPKVVDWEVAAELELENKKLAKALAQAEQERDEAAAKLKRLQTAAARAWVVQGGRMYVDKAYVREAEADKAVSERKDGSTKVALIERPALGSGTEGAVWA